MVGEVSGLFETRTAQLYESRRGEVADADDVSCAPTTVVTRVRNYHSSKKIVG